MKKLIARIVFAFTALSAHAWDKELNFDAAKAASEARPSQVSKAITLTANSAVDGLWTPGNGTMTWRYSIKVNGATDLSLWLGTVSLPPQAQIFINGEDHTHRRMGRYGLFSDTFAGDVIEIEMIVPSESAGDAKIGITSVLAGFTPENPVAVSSKSTDGMGPLDFENYNFECRRDESEAIDQAGRSVAYFQAFHPTEGGFQCTANFVNNTRGDKTPYLITATHCVLNKAPSDWNAHNEEIDAFLEDARLAPLSMTPCGHGYDRDSAFWGQKDNQAHQDFKYAGGTRKAVNRDVILIEWNAPVPATLAPVFSGIRPINAATARRLDDSAGRFFAVTHAKGRPRQFYDIKSAYASPAGTLKDRMTTVYENGTQWAAAPGASGSGLRSHDGFVLGILSTATEPERCTEPQPASDWTDADTSAGGFKGRYGCTSVSGLFEPWEETDPEKSFSYWLAPDQRSNPPAEIPTLDPDAPPAVAMWPSNYKDNGDGTYSTDIEWVADRADICKWLGANHSLSGQTAVPDKGVHGRAMHGKSTLTLYQQFPLRGIECTSSTGTHKVSQGVDSTPTPTPAPTATPAPTPAPTAAPTPAPTATSEPSRAAGESSGSGSIGLWVLFLLLLGRRGAAVRSG